MSGFIPMVSSSPPPMDEGGGFDWNEEDDDFGNFASADDSISIQSGKYLRTIFSFFIKLYAVLSHLSWL